MMKRPVITNAEFHKLLKARRIIPDSFIDDLLEELNGNALDVLATLIQSGVGTKRMLCQLWCDSIGIAHVDLEKTLFQPHIVRKMPERFARQFFAIPVYQMGDTVTVAVPAPDNQRIKKEIEKIVGGPVNLVFALPQDIEWAIDTEYISSMDVHEFFSKIKISGIFQTTAPLTEEKLSEAAGSDAANQLHAALILYGITENASEILVEPDKTGAAIDFIINGNIRRMRGDQWVYQQLHHKLHQMAKIDGASPDTPRAGRILFPTPGKKLDIQFLAIPRDFGKKLFLKILDRNPLPRVPALSELYLSKKNISKLRNVIQPPHGLFLVTGPADSGKTAFAYSMLHALKDRAFTCVTVEDGIKYLITDTRQYQVNPRAGFTRTELFNACLQTHPDVVYIQNIDDPHMTGALIRAAALENIFIIGEMTANHVHEALESVIRLGLGSMLAGIVNQHLVRRLCDHCKETHQLPSSEVEKIFTWDGKTTITACRSKGCTYCNQSGFIGRIGIQEVAMIDENIRESLNGDRLSSNIRQALAPQTSRGLEYDGIKKVLRGLTTFSEIEKIPKIPLRADIP
jgi:type IV pilus assembly protein PilB